MNRACTATPRGRRRWRAPMLAAGLAVGLLPAFSVPLARASIGACSSDPVAMLSNGVTVDLSAAISDSADDVQQVAYVLHAPPGTTVVAWIPTDGPLGPKETFQFYADTISDVYASATTVTTGAHHVAVTATTRLVAATGSPSASATGWSRHPLWVAVML